MKRYIFLVFMLAACGQPSKSGGNAELAGDGSDEAPADEAAKELPHSMLVADAASLPACTAEAQGWLVYVKAEAQFQACSAGAWSVVEVKGPKGDAGAAGAAGAKGDKGEPGKDLAIEEDPTDSWRDPQLGTLWIQMAYTADYPTAESLCGNGFAFPTKNDIFQAALHGLFDALAPSVSAWTSTADTVTGNGYHCTQPKNNVFDGECHGAMQSLEYEVYCWK